MKFMTARLGLAALAAGGLLALSPQATVVAVDNPTVTSISPHSGADSGGDTVTITGSGFYCGTGGPVTTNPVTGNPDPNPADYLNVFFGSNSADVAGVKSDGEMQVKSPGGEGTVDVVVECANSTAASSTSPADRFSYVNTISGSGATAVQGAQTSDGNLGSDASSGPASLAQTGGGRAARPSAPAGPALPWLGALLLPAALAGGVWRFAAKR